MKTIKLNISYDDFQALKEAAEHYGITPKEAYLQAICDFVEKEKQAKIANAKAATKKGQKKMFKEMAAAYKREEKRKKKERKNNPIEMPEAIEFPVARAE